MINNKHKVRFISHNLMAASRQRIQALTMQAEQASSVRDLRSLSTIADSLIEAAPSGLESIGFYYRACSLHNKGQAQSIVEPITESELPVLRARAHLALGGYAWLRSDLGLADKHYRLAESEFAACTTVDSLGLLQLRKMQGVLRSLAGRHMDSLGCLRQSWAYAEQLSRSLPALSYDLLNSIAIELSALGNTAPAIKLIRVATASPFASRFPEWTQSQTEIVQAAGAETARVFYMSSYIDARAERLRQEAHNRLRSAAIVQAVLRHDLIEVTFTYADGSTWSAR